MEDSALVIIDYNKALQDGFVQINKEMVNQFEEDSLGQQDEGWFLRVYTHTWSAK